MADIHLICQNRRARYDYHIDDTVEAGLVLLGPEVKSLREGRADLKDGYCAILRGEAWLHQVRISPYPAAAGMNPDPERPRKLLLHRAELDRLYGKVREKGYTLIPLRMYFKDGRAKVEVGLARGKKQYDKRETIKRRDAARELARARRTRR